MLELVAHFILCRWIFINILFVPWEFDEPKTFPNNKEEHSDCVQQNVIYFYVFTGNLNFVYLKNFEEFKDCSGS